MIPRAQEELLHNVFDFAGQEARDVMVPAAQVVWLPAGAGAGDALRQALARPHSRFPVGRGSLDHVVGVVHVRELAAAAQADPQPTVEDVAREAVLVPETKDLGALLRDLREQHQQLAVVADEYGRTVGIVTLEDILEEIVGEIEDEYDLPDDSIERLDDGTLRVAGSMTVDDFNELTGSALPQAEAHTLAGLVFDALGRRPEAGEQVVAAGRELTVREVGRRAHRPARGAARVRRTPGGGVMAPVRKVVLDEAAAARPEYWSQEVVGEANGSLFKVAKGTGATEWHAHADHGRGLRRHRRHAGGRAARRATSRWRPARCWSSRAAWSTGRAPRATRASSSSARRSPRTPRAASPPGARGGAPRRRPSGRGDGGRRLERREVLVDAAHPLLRARCRPGP